MSRADIVPLPIAILEEIALEGLEGITIEGLWRRLSIRLNIALPFLDHFCILIWNYCLKQTTLNFYELPIPRDLYIIIDRSDLIDAEVGVALEPETCPYNSYKYNPINSNGIRGSCEHYSTRKEIPLDRLVNLTHQEVTEKWGSKFIIVGNQKLRESLLIPGKVNPQNQLMIIQYCILERIGRSRYNGEITVGKYSLLEIVRDSNILHYHRKQLLNLKLIVKQAYHQKVNDQNTSGSLVHLPRFYVEMKPKPMILTEKVVEILKNKPNCMAEYDEIKAELGLKIKDTVKKLLKTSDFQKFVNTDLKVPYRTMYPEAEISEWKMKNKDEEKLIRVIQLIQPNIDVSEMWMKNEEEEEEQGFLDATMGFIDMTALRHVYKIIKESGSNGSSQTEISKKIGQNRLSTRTLCRNLQKLGHTTTFIADEGRQRVTRFVVTGNIDATHKRFIMEKEAIQDTCLKGSLINTDSNNAESPIKMELEVNEQIQSTDSSVFIITDVTAENSEISVIENPHSPTNILLETDIFEKHKNGLTLEKILTVIESIDTVPGTKRQHSGIGSIIESKNSAESMQSVSYRFMNRIKIILQTVKRNLVVEDCSKLLKIIFSEELRLGCKDKICKKSMIRIIGRLAVDNYIKLVSVTLKYENNSKQLMFICDNSVDFTNSILLSCIEQAKLKFILTIGTSSRKKDLLENALKKEVPAKKVIFKSKSSEDGPVLNYGFCPKFIRMRIFHEFLFYLIFTITEKQEIFTKDEAVTNWRNIHPNLNFQEIESELSDIYSTNLDWKSFVPPLVKHMDMPNGWALMSDILLRLPLSIFVKIFNITYEIPELEQVLSHPIRKHYLLKYMPTSLRESLIKNRKYIFSIDEIAKRLCYSGLLQFGQQRLKEKDQVFIYLNRNAILLNTVSSEPGYYKITEKPYETIKYRFETLEDISKYWHDMWSICMNTRLGKRNFVVERELTYELLHVKPTILASIEAQSYENAIENDVGKIPGDNLGAAGLDSAFFSHIKRNWNWQMIKCKKPATQKSSLRAKKLDGIKSTPIQFKKLMREREIDGKRKKIKRFVTPIPKCVNLPRKTKVLYRRIKEQRVRARNPHYDEIDKHALTLMNKLRVEWSRAEDNMILLCKVGMMYFTTNSKKQTITSQVVRDILHFSTKSTNKTSRACQRRIVYMLKNQATLNNVHVCLEEVKENIEINKRFGVSFIEELRAFYKGDETKFIEATKIHFIDLVVLLKKYFDKLSFNNIGMDSLITPDTIEEFYQKFIETETDVNTAPKTTIRYHDPTTRFEVELNTVNLLIHSSMCCNKDKTSCSVQLFDIYKNYSDKLLTETMKKIRLDQLISLSKHASRIETTSKKFMPLNAHPYHLSITYQNQLLTQLSYEILDEIYFKYVNCLRHFFQLKSNMGMELSTTDPGTCLMLAELVHNKKITIQIDTPSQVLVLDPTKEKEDPVYERICTRFSEIFSYLPKLDISDDEETIVLPAVPTTAEVVPINCKVKFINENNIFSFNIHPIEKLMKYPDHHFHFFCLLNSIGSNVHPQTFTLNENICSIDCVLSRNNFIENSLEILEQKKDFLKNIKKCDYKIDQIIVKEDNLLEIFYKLIEKLNNEKKLLNKKDYSKVTDVILQPIIETVKEIIDDTDGDTSWLLRNSKIENCDEKILRWAELKNGLDCVFRDDMTEKIRRLHDFLVVNSSRLYLHLNKENILNEEDMELKEFCRFDVPKNMMLIDSKTRNDILDNFVSKSLWKSEQRDDKSFHAAILTENFASGEALIAIDMLYYVEQQAEMGATAKMLLNKFKNQTLLEKVFKILENLTLVYKVGVHSITFVYWMYVQPWLINSYHIYRLERESMEPTSTRLMHINDRKRKACFDGEEDEDDEVPEKYKKSGDSDISSIPKRLVKITVESTSESFGEVSRVSSNRQSIQFRPAPWIRVNGSLNRRVLDRWLGALVLYIFHRPGSSIFKISSRFNYLQPITVRNIIELLVEIGCLQRFVVRKQRVSLFSTWKSNVIESATDFDSLEETFIEPMSDALLKLTLFIGDKNYKTDFI